MKRALVHFLKGINCLSVFLLLLIYLIPIVYKEVLSEEGFSLSRIISSVLYTLPVCFLVASIKKKWLFVVVSSFLMMVSFFETIMVVLYKNFLIAGNIISALNTTADEGSGFVMSSLHALPWILPLFLVFGLLVWKYKNPHGYVFIWCEAANGELHRSSYLRTFQNLTEDYYDNYNFCPYCGRKLEEKSL